MENTEKSILSNIQVEATSTIFEDALSFGMTHEEIRLIMKRIGGAPSRRMLSREKLEEVSRELRFIGQRIWRQSLSLRSRVVIETKKGRFLGRVIAFHKGGKGEEAISHLAEDDTIIVVEAHTEIGAETKLVKFGDNFSLQTGWDIYKSRSRIVSSVTVLEEIYIPNDDGCSL